MYDISILPTIDLIEAERHTAIQILQLVEVIDSSNDVNDDDV